jgi:hypothetical protein
VARRTDLYQRPRSPLIQGRTRWERPLWESWLAGACFSGAAALTAWYAAKLPLMALAWAVGAAVVFAGFGSLLARLWGWRMRWIGATLAGLVAVGVVSVWFMQAATAVGR